MIFTNVIPSLSFRYWRKRKVQGLWYAGLSTQDSFLPLKFPYHPHQVSQSSLCTLVTKIANALFGASEILNTFHQPYWYVNSWFASLSSRILLFFILFSFASMSKRIVVCFDGTSNSNQGITPDTNMVKLYQKLDRTIKNQHLYNQHKSTLSGSLYLLTRARASCWYLRVSTAEFGTYSVGRWHINYFWNSDTSCCRCNTRLLDTSLINMPLPAAASSWRRQDFRLRVLA